MNPPSIFIFGASLFTKPLFWGKKTPLKVLFLCLTLVSMIPTYYFPLLIKDHIGGQSLSGISRVSVARDVMWSTWEYDPSVFYSPNAYLVNDIWSEYLDREVESCRHYDDLKLALSGFYGDTVFEWLRDYTTFLIRSQRLHQKYGGKDSVAVTIEERIQLLNPIA